jgi:hypothetical protein
MHGQHLQNFRLMILAWQAMINVRLGIESKASLKLKGGGFR